MTKYTRLFINESRVYIPGMSAILRRLREGTPEEDDTREGQRLSHSIKGMALFEEQPGIAVLSTAMERGFEQLREQGTCNPLVGALEQALPLLARMVDHVEERGATLVNPEPAVAAIEAELSRTTARRGLSSKGFDEGL